MAERNAFEIKLAYCAAHSAPGALGGARAPTGKPCEETVRLGEATGTLGAEQYAFPRNTLVRLWIALFSLTPSTDCVPPTLQDASLQGSLLGLAFAGPVTRERLTRTVDSKSRAREAAHAADDRRRALLTLPAPSDDACAYVEETYFGLILCPHAIPVCTIYICRLIPHTA